MVNKLSYEDMADKLEVLMKAYWDACAAVPPNAGNRIMHRRNPQSAAYPTTDILLDLWEKHRAATLSAFADGGWTETEFDEELERRVSSAFACT